AIPPDRFNDLVTELEALTSTPSPISPPLELLSTHDTSEYYFWADQGRQLIDSIPSSFDKVEMAVLTISEVRRHRATFTSQESTAFTCFLLVTSNKLGVII
ncbi:hypothetical protein VaNZ11_015136, partial [Volvox africanus]